MACLRLRIILAMLGMYACGLVYTHRAAISVAMVAMAQNQKSSDPDAVKQPGECFAGPDDSKIFTTSPLSKNSDLFSMKNSSNGKKPEFEWDPKLQGIILGSQFYLYIFVPTLAGRATDALGGKWIVFFGALGPCILAALTPIMARVGAWALIVNRILVGGFHGFTYAAVFSLYIKWFPSNELSVANGSMIFGGSLGSTIMSLLAGSLCETSIGWPLVFYALALIHVPFLVLWYFLVTNEPATNRCLSEDERKYIEQNAQQKVISTKIKAPWLKMICSVPVICSLITKMCSGFGYFLLITMMPSYLSQVFGIALFKNGGVSAATNLANGVTSFIAPPIANVMIHRCKMNRLIVRKLFQSIALFGPALCLGLIPLTGCDPTPAIFLLIGAMMLYGFFSAGEWTIVSEYAPNFAGTVFGLANILAFAMGVFAPYIAGVLLDDQSQSSRSQWNIIFYIAVVIYVVGGLTFVIFATDKQQNWDRNAVQNVPMMITKSSDETSRDDTHDE